MHRFVRMTLAALTVAALLAGGCSRSDETRKTASRQEAEARSLRTAMTGAAAALGQVEARLGAGDLAGARGAYRDFQSAFGNVLAPTSFANPELATRMANANTRLKELLAEQAPIRADAVVQAKALMAAINQAAKERGYAVLAQASGQVGGPAEAPASGLQSARQPEQVITVEATEYRLSPARLDVPLGTKVTIRMVNKGTMKHEFELDAFQKEIKPIPPGAAGEITFVADKAGVFQYACRLDDHERKGMIGFLNVK